MRQAIMIGALAALVIAGASPRGFAQATEPASCLDCHNDAADAGEDRPPGDILSTSIHADLDCTDCHQSLSMESVDATSPTPHGEAVAPVDCGECHEEAAEVYTQHGRLEVGKDPDLPACWSCHGAHDILATDDTDSRVHPINLPETCRACHVDVDLVKRHEFLRDAPIRLYENSIHGQASRKGRYMAATCNDCHSAPESDGKRTAHRILGAGDSDSPISFFNIPNTCGSCHPTFMKDYWEGIHGKMVKRGKVDAPVCTTCHGEHGIIDHKDPRSPVSATRVAEATCSPCHESEVLNEKYGIPAGRLTSYIDSYHGLKSRASTSDDVKVANCSSCHGPHRILPHTDPDSSIHPDNLQATCGECHEQISVELASASIHESATGLKTGWPHFVRVLYLWLIGITIGLMLLHNIADIVRHVQLMRRKPYVVRMTPNETFQHWLLTVSFIILVVSGFSLRFSEAFWVKWLFDWGDGKGFVFRGEVHRIAAVLFAFCCVWHLFYLFGHRGRHALRDMILAKRDFVDIKNSAAYFLGLRDDRPQFGRFSYMEKCEYWALAWGGVIMTLTGVLLWFDNYFVQRWALPKGILDVVLVIHYYEAWLATLAILVWHGYSVLFSPHVYPMNPSWLGGTMPKDMYTHEHPEGPRLKARVQRTFDEDEEEPDNRAG
ncbi:MAG: hypothetical protein GY842_26100 [bacterium]|nr:hypothetical protein [bacterium]